MHRFDMAKLVRRMGVLGFLFFFTKGMLWLTVPALLGWLAL